jgi:hypothetical protein
MKLYGVFFETDRNPRWAMTRNKRQALKAARKAHGYVTAMNEPSGGGPWDAPTFKVCSDLIADYRVTHPAGTRVRLHPACEWFPRGAHYATISQAVYTEAITKHKDATPIRVKLELMGRDIRHAWIRLADIQEVL